MEAKKRLLTVASIGGALLLLYGSGLLRWMQLERERASLTTEIASLKADNGWLYEETRRLREDPAYAEAVARRELGFVRPGETVIKLKGRKEFSQR